MRVLRPSTTQASSEPMTAFPMAGVYYGFFGGEGEGCQPGSYGAPSQDESVDVRGVLAAVEADGDQHREIEYQ